MSWKKDNNIHIYPIFAAEDAFISNINLNELGNRQYHAWLFATGDTFISNAILNELDNR